MSFVKVESNYAARNMTHEWHSDSRDTVLNKYRNIYPPDESGRGHHWDGDTLHRTRTIHGYGCSVPAQDRLTFHEERPE